MRERDLYTPVQKWMRMNMRQTCAIELKICKGKNFNMSEVKEHQVANLRTVARGFFGYKIADVGYDQKPFDLFFINESPAYVGIVFYEERKKKRLYLIPIQTFMFLKKASVKPSLSELDCLAFSSAVADL